VANRAENKPRAVRVEANKDSEAAADKVDKKAAVKKAIADCPETDARWRNSASHFLLPGMNKERS
jgi:hypothetical protein